MTPDEQLEYAISKSTLSVDIREHLRFMHDLVIEKNAKVVVELGMRWGEGSTVAFLVAVSKTNGKLYSCDIKPCIYGRNFIAKSGLGAYWHFTIEDDLKWGEIWNEPIDILFIDTEHNLEQATKELNLWMPKVKSDGVVLMHDTVSAPEVLRAIKNYVKTHPEYTYSNRENNNGLGIITKI